MSLKLKVLSFLPFSLTVALEYRIIFQSKSSKLNVDIIDSVFNVDITSK